MLQKLKTLPVCSMSTATSRTKGSQAGLVIDRAAAARLGITTQAIDNTLYDAFGQRQVSTMYTRMNQYHVVIEVDPQFWQNPEGLKYIYVKGRGRHSGAAQRRRALRAIDHLAGGHPSGQFPSVTLSFNLAPGTRFG